MTTGKGGFVDNLVINQEKKSVNTTYMRRIILSLINSYAVIMHIIFKGSE